MSVNRSRRRPRNFGDHPDNPHPSVMSCEWSAEELAERYVAARRARMVAARAKDEGEGDGDQAATPSRQQKPEA